MNRKPFIPVLVLIIVLALVITQTDSRHVFSLEGGDTVLSATNQTIPTRTPTPGPQPPTKTPAPKPTSSDGGGDDPATAVPTSTNQPLPTNTAPPLVTIAYTPVGGFVPTAEPCGDQPTIQAVNATNVRQGPGTNYPIIDKLVYLEVRFIVGRAADAAWWVIQLEDGTNGWVADSVVNVQGYIGGVPIVPAPEIGDQSPTAGAPWNPTPQPGCVIIPTATATATAVPPTATATSITAATAVATEAASADPESTTAETTADSAAAAPDSETDNELAVETEEVAAAANAPAPQPTQTAVSPPTLMPVTNANQPEESAAVQPAAAPMETAAPRSSVDWLLPAAGLLLIAGGATSVAARRKK